MIFCHQHFLSVFVNCVQIQMVAKGIWIPFLCEEFTFYSAFHTFTAFCKKQLIALAVRFDLIPVKHDARRSLVEHMLRQCLLNF